MATHSSVIAWRIPRTEEPGGLQSRGSRSRTRLRRLSTRVYCEEGQSPEKAEGEAVLPGGATCRLQGGGCAFVCYFLPKGPDSRKDPRSLSCHLPRPGLSLSPTLRAWGGMSRGHLIRDRV